MTNNDLQNITQKTKDFCNIDMSEKIMFAVKVVVDKLPVQ